MNITMTASAAAYRATVLIPIGISLTKSNTKHVLEVRVFEHFCTLVLYAN